MGQAGAGEIRWDGGGGMSQLTPPVRPYYSRTHYQDLIAVLRDVPMPDRLIAAEILCRVFQQDNPKFKPAMFMAQVMETEQ
jgi:hypothetical protein